MTKPYQIGIIGGMGPLAGVELQRHIIEATPAESDQDHIQVLTYTNPAIPDRTESLSLDGGRSFVHEVVATGKLLESAGSSVLAMPCMTAHSRHDQIQAGLTAPLLNAVTLTCQTVAKAYPNTPVVLLATDGSVRSGVYTSNIVGRALNWRLPSADQQATIMKVIYELIKAGQSLELAASKLIPVMTALRGNDNPVFVLGCTELGLIYPLLNEAGFNLVDPLRVLAQQLVLMRELPANLHEATPLDARSKSWPNRT